MEIEFKEVSSSNITAVGYDAKSQTLAIRFRNSGRYDFAEVPQELYLKFMMSESLGKGFATLIRGKFAFTKIEEKEVMEEIAESAAKG